MMSRCPQCGTELPEQYRFCPHCGAPQETVAGSPPPVEVRLTGPGAIAQGTKAAAAGEDGVAVAGGVGGDVLGAGARKEVHYHGAEGLSPASMRTAYLNRVLEATSYLSLAGIDPKAASESEARLALGAVYTALLTLTPEPHDRMVRGEDLDWEARRLSALEQLNRNPRLVLLGDPGSGKSTFVNFVAMCLAGETLAREDANLALLTAPLPDEDGGDQNQPQPWEHGVLLPVRVILRDLAARGLPPADQEATAEHLWRFVASQLEAAALGGYAPHLGRELQEQGGLLLLDGLDEVPEAGRRRAQIKQAVEDFAATFPHCRMLVTSRTYAYQKQDWRLPGFAEAVLAPFSQGQIHRFVDRWFAHIASLRGLDADDAQGRAELLKRAIFGSDRLQALAERPLLLTLMASLHAWRGGSLPQKREELYADTVDLLLDWWESQRVVRDGQGSVVMMQPSLAEWLKVDRQKMRNLLNEVAYEAHAAQPDLAGTADILDGDLVGGLMRLSQNPEVNPARLVEYLSRRAGLLLPRGVGVYTFPHRTFQEYLAACHLTDHEYPDLVAGLARKDPNRWREVALLAGAKSARGSDFALWVLVEALCYRDLEGEEQSEADAWGALLAGQALVESADLERVSERNLGKVTCVRCHLVRILEDGRLPPVERAAAGRALARLGDLRPGVGVLSPPPPAGEGPGMRALPDILWCYVPPGPFTMGSADEDEMAWDGEKPRHPNDSVTEGYLISRYPVTNAQFAAFVEAGGYRERQYWTEAGWRWKEQEELKGSYDPGEPFNLPNHPVVGVSWYEAVAYCRWLGERLQVSGFKFQVWCGGQTEPWNLEPETLTVRLPSEAEWEKAARGTDGRVFPWGGEADSDRANYVDTGIGTTSAVGCFPGGASPYEVEDLSGNVWEWPRSLYREYPYDPGDGREDLEAGRDVLRVLRGGAFNLEARFVRCASRFRLNPLNRYRNHGFRVLASPVHL